MSTKTFKEKLSEARRTKSFRIWFLVILFAILLAMYLIWGKMKILLIVLMVLVAWAIWLEATDYDLDLETLWETGSIEESRVENKNWVKLIWWCISDNLNCSNFDTQDEAQAHYEKCAANIKEYNKDIDDVKSLDVYWLDRDKDWIVCESLPAFAN